MKTIPYNLYIHFDELNSLFSENLTRQENAIKCGLSSIELSMSLLGSILKNNDVNARVKSSHILRGIEKQFELISAYTQSFQCSASNYGYSENIENLKSLPQSYAESIDRISQLYFGISRSLGIGWENQMNDIRKHFLLSEIVSKSPSNTFLQEGSVIPDLSKLGKQKYFNSEDELFMRIHQISECWFHIVIQELISLRDLFLNSEPNSPEVELHFNVIYDVLIYLADHILLLEHMVLSDYHPLRVALRGASGGQSQQAHKMFSLAKETFTEFLKHVENTNKTIVRIIETPKLNANLLSIINHFSKLERSLKNFFFQHYILSSNTIGSESFGSVGHDLISLTDKFVQPIFKEIDDAKYDLTMKTNFQYGKFAGKLILEKEEATTIPDQSHITKNEDLISKAIESYFKTIGALNSEEWIQLFSENGYIEDPVGSRPYIGHRQLGVFFKGIVRFFVKINMSIEMVQRKEDVTEVTWKAEATVYNGKEIKFNGKEVFQINKEGKIEVARVHWDPTIISNQL